MFPYTEVTPTAGVLLVLKRGAKKNDTTGWRERLMNYEFRWRYQEKSLKKRRAPLVGYILQDN